jgi:hypothetical protein
MAVVMPPRRSSSDLDCAVSADQRLANTGRAVSCSDCAPHLAHAGRSLHWHLGRYPDDDRSWRACRYHVARIGVGILRAVRPFGGASFACAAAGTPGWRSERSGHRLHHSVHWRVRYPRGAASAGDRTREGRTGPGPRTIIHGVDARTRSERWARWSTDLVPAVPTAWALATGCMGMWIGQIMRTRLSPMVFRGWFFLGLLILGIDLVARSAV